MKRIATCLILVGSLTMIAASASEDVWINEFHYDNADADVNEGVEIAGPAGVVVDGYRVILYNGDAGQLKPYGTVSLSGTIDDEGCGFGALWFSRSEIQNGSPDGLALVDGGTTSYSS